MLLKDYIPNVKSKYKKITFSGIAFDSSKVKKNNIFFVIKGNKFDGNDFIDNAIKNGAKIIISEKKISKKKTDIIYLNSLNVRKLLAETSYKIFKKKPKRLVAVTGTNGKSSIADFYYQILRFNYKKVASIGTIGLRYEGSQKTLMNTTSDPIQLSIILNDMINKRTEFIIMEASSHGLHQNRLDGLKFDVGIFTNLSHDHLDYHKSMKHYLNSKLYLFNNLIKDKGDIITDVEIPQAKKIKNISIRKKLNLSMIFEKNNGIQLLSHKFEDEKQILEVQFKKRKYKFLLDLIGKIQIKNLLMAILAANKSGLEFKKIIGVLPKVKPVEGRLEKIGRIKNNSKVILDYAHTPDALELTLLNLKNQFPSNKINLLFGCGGNRDLKKRPIMGKIADKLSNKIYLTDDNPRNENPSNIRKEIKKGIKKTKVSEIPDRKKAIKDAIKDLNTGDILLVAGKGHEKTQDYGSKKIFFSDKEIILKSIKLKNKSLSKNLKINIIKEKSKSEISNKLPIRKISIDSRTIKKNDVFFAIKGKKFDGNKFVTDVFKKKTSFVIVNKFNKKYLLSKQVKVKDTLNFLSECSSTLRDNVNTKIISITGSCGKTSLKEMIGNVMGKISKTSYSPKSFNNKYGVPLSLFNLNQNDDFGVFEVGMDKKGEIDKLTKIIKPNVGVITNISYAHSKNFKNIKHIAEAKAEIMNNMKPNGTIILNRDDTFFHYHKNFANKKKLKVLSFGIKEKNSEIRLIKIKNKKNKYELFCKVNKTLVSYYSKNNNSSNIYNILATLAVINLYKDISLLKKDVFYNLNTPNGRGDISKLNFKDKKIFLVDETYNSNPLSLKIAIENYEKIDSGNSKKHLILGDMLELGKYSIPQHRLISKIINKTKINKVYVVGKYIKETFKGLKSNKKAKMLKSKFDIFNLVKQFDNGDYLMIKGSNATGLNKIAINLKQSRSHVV
jgi:murE/murF fusion protein